MKKILSKLKKKSLKMKLFKSALNCLLPNTCILCGSTKCDTLDLCADCQNEMPTINSVCIKCAKSLADSQEKICGDCLNRPPPFEKTVALYSYENPADYLITQIKFHNKLLYANILGKLFAKKLQIHYEALQKPEIIVPVPLHASRLKKRGYNQALEIAKPIAKRMQIPIDKYSYIRVKNTEMQSSLTADEREKNIKRAFSIEKRHNITTHRHVAVIDDVITTGNTMVEFCKILRKNGVSRIDVWCCARALFNVI